MDKYYILNMFPYPSGDGLHVGHALGYVSSDIFARYKKMKGYKVINPMGFDSFGLPAEQFAILTGQHPSITTDKNVSHYIEQMKKMDLDFNWECKFNTSDPDYYKWTQWIFIQMFDSFYCKLDNKAHKIEYLYKYFSKNGTNNIGNYVFSKDSDYNFTADQWNNFSEIKKYKISLDYRIAYLDDIEVNWCEELKTVLANDEVKNGVSERGGYPVVKKKMKQWALRITAFADRLLDDLDSCFEKVPDYKNHVKIYNNSPLKKGLETEKRNIILAIIKHWSENKYLIIKYKKDGSIAFLTGGIEENEDIKTAVIREIKEETGFIDIKKIEKICNTDCTFYHNRKNKNLQEFTYNYYVELNSGKNVEISAEEQKILEYQWVDEDKIEDSISYEEHLYPFKIFKNNTTLNDYSFKYIDKTFDLGLKDGLAVEHANIISAIIKHWSEDKYLILKYPKDNSIGFLTGKIEEDEAPIDALIREIREETGFINLKRIEPICRTKCLCYLKRKNINVESNSLNYYVELKDAEQVEISDEEKNKQIYSFVDKSDIYKYITDEDFIYNFYKLNANYKTSKLDWPESTKEMQRNWIGRSEGANIKFKVDELNYELTIFTSRPETIFGVTFLSISKDHDFVKQYCNDLDLANINNDSEGKRGIKTKYYATNPINNTKIPIWIANYILSDYGTGAIMGVPQLDDRDNEFAKIYNIEIKEIYKDNKFINSQYLNGLDIDDAKKKIITKLKKINAGEPKITYKLRDAIFSRQRYWGEPIPIYYKDVTIDNVTEKLPFVINETDLPLKLPAINDFKPTGEPPLKKASNWTYNDCKLEINTMPGWAGSSWYFLRYLDSKNNNEFVSKDKLDEYNNVDFYLGGSEHAVGHLLYSRFYTKFLYDLGYINFDEPFKKLIHQGMILGESAIIYRNDNNEFISGDLITNYQNLTPIHINVNFVDKDNNVDVEKLKNWRQDFNNSNFINNNDNKFICSRIIEKMSKSKYNVINPDDVIDKYNSDILRMYLMFLGPIEQSKPWDIKGIEGIVRFLNKVNSLTEKIVDKEPNTDELKIINKCIKNVENNIENYSFNTAISSMMICVNELRELENISKKTFKNYLLLLKSFAPKTVKLIWKQLFNNEDIDSIRFPEYDERYITKGSNQYPIMINGKLRTKIQIDKNATDDEIKKIILDDPIVKKWIDSKTIKKIIIIKEKIINIVI